MHRFVLSIVAGVSLMPAFAAAQGDDLPARTEFEQAQNEFDQGHYALALRGFQRSYELLEGHPNQGLMLFNIGRTYEALEYPCEARDNYRRFLEEAPRGVPQLGVARTRVTALDAQIAANPAICEQRADRALASETDGAASAPGDGGSDGGGGVSPIGPIVLGVGGAMLVVGAVLGGLAVAGQSEVVDTCGDDMRCPESSRARADEVATQALVADVMLFGGAAVALGGLLLTLLLRDGADDAPRAGVACGTVGCVASLRGAW